MGQMMQSIACDDSVAEGNGLHATCGMHALAIHLELMWSFSNAAPEVAASRAEQVNAAVHVLADW